jgi:hypothetical protein
LGSAQAPATKRGLSALLYLSQAARRFLPPARSSHSQMRHVVIVLRDGRRTEGIGFNQIGTGGGYCS